MRFKLQASCCGATALRKVQRDRIRRGRFTDGRQRVHGRRWKIQAHAARSRAAQPFHGQSSVRTAPLWASFLGRAGVHLVTATAVGGGTSVAHAWLSWRIWVRPGLPDVGPAGSTRALRRPMAAIGPSRVADDVRRHGAIASGISRQGARRCAPCGLDRVRISVRFAPVRTASPIRPLPWLALPSRSAVAASAPQPDELPALVLSRFPAVLAQDPPRARPAGLA